MESKVVDDGGAAFYFDGVYDLQRAEYHRNTGREYPLTRIKERLDNSIFYSRAEITLICTNYKWLGIFEYRTSFLFRLFSSCMCMVVPYRSPRLALIDPVLLAMVEAGITRRLLSRHAPSAKNSPDVPTAASPEDEVRVEIFYLPVLVCSCLLAAAAAVFAGESGRRMETWRMGCKRGRRGRRSCREGKAWSPKSEIAHLRQFHRQLCSQLLARCENFFRKYKYF